MFRTGKSIETESRLTPAKAGVGSQKEMAGDGWGENILKFTAL